MGIDYVPTAIEAATANGQDVAGLSYDAMPAHSCRIAGVARGAYSCVA
jgi:hypothetical protein